MATIAVLGTLDTKGEEHAYVAEMIRDRGHHTLLIDVGTDLPPRVPPNVSRHEVAHAGGIDLTTLMERHDRGECVAAMGRAAAAILQKLQSERKIDGVISLGGGGGTSICTEGMRALPLGFPKVMVSTLASGNTSQYIGARDIVMVPAVVDVAGLNRVSRMVLSRAAGAICGMVETHVPAADDKPIIVASMFGNTTKCVQTAKEILEGAGYEVLVFHATGTGGRAMESLIESGMVVGVLDVTTTEWADELVGGILGAGPTRLDAAAKAGLPTIIAPGCLDMVNFGPRNSVPAKFADRVFYQHNPQVTLMRTTPEECAELGRIIAEKANQHHGPVTVLIPKKAVSIISASGQPFHSPAADRALFDSIKKHLEPEIPLVEMDAEINDDAFAAACANTLLSHLQFEKS
jgi:uncharacterized protein (UPF0261 family)